MVKDGFKLVFAGTDIEANKDDKLTAPGGEVTLLDGDAPYHAASAGRIYVRTSKNLPSVSWLPSICGLEWVRA